jgi:3-oxoacyl-[acyl-carrier-protein] synthase II
MARAKRFSGFKRGFRRFAKYAGERVRRARRNYKGWRNRSHAEAGGAGNAPRRAVITGIGAITVLGLDTVTTWQKLVAGKSGIGPITVFDSSPLPVHIAGEVKGFDPLKYVEPKEARRMSRCSHFAVAAAKEALQDSGIVIGKDVPHDRVGVVMGTAMGGFEMVDNGLQEYRQFGYKRSNPFALPASLANSPGHHISTYFGAKGLLSTVVAACASGTQSIGDAAEAIRHGRADVVFSGGVEATVIEGAIVAFSLMRVLSTHHNDRPEQAARPFDATRDGFVFSEGCVVMMVEELEHARARGAHIYAEVLGMGVSSDAYHIAIPDPKAGGAIRAMQWALEDAGVPPHRVDYINAHGSGTQANDPLETMAIKSVFGEHAHGIPVSSTKSMVGHAMGAAGAIEALSCVMSIQHGIIPPTINLNSPDPECDLDYVPNVARQREVNIALSNSFGLGGQNACVLFGKVEPVVASEQVTSQQIASQQVSKSTS